MKKFLWFLLIAIFMIVLADRSLSFLLDILYREIRTGQTGGKINSYLAMPTQPAILIMGNSRSLYQVIPDSFKVSGFNLSHAGMGQTFQTALLDILCIEEKLPKVLLLHLELYEFTNEYSSTDILGLKYYYGKNELVTTYTNELSPHEFIKFYASLYRYNGMLIPVVKNYFLPKNPAEIENGYEIIYPKPQDSLNTIYSFEKSVGLGEPPLQLGQFEKLQKFIDLAKGKRVNLVCFTSPVFGGINQYPKTMNKLDSLLQKNGVPYIDYIRDPIPYLNEKPGYWRDAYHLNHNGAQVLSGELAEAIGGIADRKN